MCFLRFKSGAHPQVFVLSILLLIIGITAAWYVRDLYKDLSNILELNVTSVRAAEELEISLRETRSRLIDLSAPPTPSDLQSIFDQRRETERWIREASLLATTPHEQTLMALVNSGYSRFTREIDKLLSNSDTEISNTEIRLNMDRILKDEIIPPAHQYLDYNEETMLSVAREHQVFSSRFSWLILAIGVCGGIGGFFAGFQASRRMRQSMVELNLPLSLTAGKLSEVVGPIFLSTTLDLSELKRVLDVISGEVDRVVARLQKSQETVLRSEKLAAIGQLAAGTAHEIRNPLMSIKLLVQSALKDPISLSLSFDDLTLIEQEICRLERTVQNLLDFAKPPIIEREKVKIEELLKYCTTLIAGRAQIQKVTIRRRISDAHLTVDADFQQLKQVILNLMINSLDAMPEEGELLFDVGILNDQSPMVTVKLLDSGKGIPKELLNVLFEPFVSSKESGTGLGLSICRKIIEAHKGEMFALNQSEGGAMVGFTLPLSSPSSPM